MAKFYMNRVPDLRGKGDKKMYPKMVREGMKTNDAVAEAINYKTGVTVVDVKKVLAALGEVVRDGLADGYSVKIEGLGVFSASLAVVGSNSLAADSGGDDQRNRLNVRVGGINYLSDKGLVAATAERAQLECVKAPVREGVLISKEGDRLNALHEYLKSNPFINVPQYQKLTGLTHTPAAKELLAFSKDFTTGIGAIGSGSHKVYVLA